MIPHGRPGATRRIELVGGETPGPGGSGPEKREGLPEKGSLGAEDLHRGATLGGERAPKNPGNAFPLPDANRDSPSSNFSAGPAGCDIYVTVSFMSQRYFGHCVIYVTVSFMSQ